MSQLIVLIYVLSQFILILNTHVNSEKLNLNSKLNTFELENFKYKIDLTNTIKLNSIYTDTASTNQNLLKLKSKNGQPYECNFADLENNPFNKDLYPDDEDEQDETNLNTNPFFETSSSIKNLHDKNPQYNFTLINEKIKIYMDQLKQSNLCIYKNLGWWTYEFCFGRHASQYHVHVNGTILGDIIILGNYTNDFNWLEVNQTKTFPISSGILYHEQYYDLGSVCELTNKPRRATVKLFCNENLMNHVDLINEVETCVYEIYVNSHSICNIPHFSKKSTNFDILCNPVVKPNVYLKYLEKQQELNNKRSNEQIETIELNKKIDETKLNLDGYDDNELDIDISDQADLLFKEDIKLADIKSQIKQSEDEISNLVENANKFNKIVNKVKTVSQLNEQDEASLNQMKNLIDSTANELEKTDELFDKIANKLNKIIDQLNDEENSLLNQVDKKDAKVELTILDTGKNVNLNNNGDNLKDFEQKLMDNLAKTNKLGDKLKSNNIKVKIIRLDPKQADDLESNGLNSLLSSLFNSNEQTEKIRNLKQNYESVYNEDSIIKQTNEQNLNENDDENILNENDNLIVY